MKKIGMALNVVIALFWCWLFISWVDVVLHNTMPNPQYQPWNLFVLFF